MVYSDKQRVPFSNRDICAIYAPFANTGFNRLGASPSSTTPVHNPDNILVIEIPAMFHEEMSGEAFLDKYSETASSSDFPTERFVHLFDQRKKERKSMRGLVVYMFVGVVLTVAESKDIEQFIYEPQLFS